MVPITRRKSIIKPDLIDMRRVPYCDGTFRNLPNRIFHASPQGDALRRGLPHIKSRAQIQNTERGEEHRLGRADRPDLQCGGRSAPITMKSEFKIFTPS
jgi:hypothetical protein